MYGLLRDHSNCPGLHPARRIFFPSSFPWERPEMLHRAGLLWPTRMLLNIIRTIPSCSGPFWQVVIVGSNSLAGVIALTLYSVGYLAKFFSETFESTDLSSQNALKSLRASPLQAFQYGLWPNARPIIWSHCLWMLEYNVRSASIIGYVGAGGIGLHLNSMRICG